MFRVEFVVQEVKGTLNFVLVLYSSVRARIRYEWKPSD